MLPTSRRSRWLTAGSVALLAHTIVVARACGDEPLPMHAWVEGTPEPTFLHMAVVKRTDKGAAVAAATPYAPVPRRSDDDVAMRPPLKPKLGMWVLDVPVRSQRPRRDAADAGARDAGPQ